MVFSVVVTYIRTLHTLLIEYYLSFFFQVLLHTFRYQTKFYYKQKPYFEL